ncbi:pyruvate formate lyase activating enzyme [Butyrivibrio proteoclasticus]|uniref:Pyruvate formate lyase activating enzyme n=1 Tax=Butyrivibrio proteoclasticus TaxID=43305 RepID=A0A1I5UFB7_9FIRM|nr:AmmeMemoRadiSam system radical SAM enzyme [Butyrivibrio proteoclasticus]SFP93727.1 pyruvate formate lyase activating enzyme [Butyrivibrio proteoclasticus]
MPTCNVCYRKCMISEGKNGFCGVRGCRNGKIVPLNYGRITSIALDPIEKKPLNRFMPGAMILSVGSYGCNLRCPFCQNYEISWSDGAYEFEKEAEYVSPERLAELADRYKTSGNIGVAFTYNEPLIGYEFVRDTARLVHDRGMKNVLVSNGMASLDVLEEIIPYIDAMNIDLKGFSDSFYSDVLLGNRRMVMDFIAEAVKHCHVEITTLIIPGENDSDEEITEISKWIASLKDKSGNAIGKKVPLHISRFFPRFKMTDRPPTDVDRIYHLADIARKNLDFVYTGNC